MNGIELYAPRTARHRRTWTAAAIFLVVVFIVAGQAATVFGVLKPMGFHQADLETKWVPALLQLLGFGFSALLVFAWAGLFERRGPVALGFNTKPLVRYGRGLLVGFGFLATVIGVIWALGGYRVENLGVWAAPAPALFIPIICLFGGFMIQGATEEILLRGWLMQLVASRHGLIVAIVINAIVFSLLHAGNIKPSKELVLGLLNIVLFAVMISLYAIKEGSLWGVCAWHSAWNTLLGVGFGLEVSGEKLAVAPAVIDLAPVGGAQWWLTGASFGPEASVVTTFVLLIGTAYLLATGALKAQGHAKPEPVQTAA
ncbi:type II CAAX endopeptidase family protein [Asticcacaulis sp. 201]|uniref:CPBP family intramembrane glutamic endopeptidase n=1 Tax=Asticcacaulis sp. 201 TaxID=3028787 RepID=UPI002916624E|nr:type II CAAX endopeptidase family protein [Asticcacaulis sp. 201]MDV6330087.1 type II CAAX endopeptidase family protein [Asticcacaulis sp. 201]